ncbi:MAG: hypothetical protein U9O65_00055 [Thermotogota bacterium]|nr:hypothetical protein [Thermotogota bacterium]
MLRAIVGDIIGSVYEGTPIKTTDFPLFQNSSTFTDDTVLTIAVADSILSGTKYEEKLKEYFRKYPDRGFGGIAGVMVLPCVSLLLDLLLIL